MPLRVPAFLLTTAATMATMPTVASAEVITAFTPFIHDTDRPEILTLEGTIDGRTPDMFQRALERFEGVTTLELASNGGSVYDALPLAYFVRRVGLKTDIPGGKNCASACSYLFFAGVGRDAEGRLGVHAIAMPSNDLKAGQRALGEIFRAFEDFGVPSVVHTRMMATPAENMYWFEPAEMIALGLIGQIGARRSDADLLASLRSQLDLETSLPEWAGPPPGITPGQIAAVEQQRRTVAAAGNDIEARDVLAGYEATLGNYRVAHQHKSYVIALRGARATVDDYTMLAYYLVAAANGRVSSEAEAAVRLALSGDRSNGIALYYLGLMYGQNDRADVALAIWRDLWARSRPGDAWYEPIRSQIDQVADAAGVNYTAPAAPAVAPAPVPPIPAAPPVGDGPATGRPAPGAAPAAPQTGAAASASYPEPSGLAIFAAALIEQNHSASSWSGPVSQPSSNTPYSMRLFLSGGFLKVDYPELSCGGYWELEDNSRDDVAIFRERLTYGQGRCLDNGWITLHMGGSGGLRYEYSGASGGAAMATAMLRAN